jgi:predicted deacetylase
METGADSPVKSAPLRLSLVVSLHDVSPHTWAACARILDELAALELRAVSLLVIPDHHHRGHFLVNEPFCAWLRARVAEGAEAVIHGYFHQRAARAGETLRERIVTRSYTAGEGEFFDITREAARELVSKARDEFLRAGLAPTGFIAPAWLLSSEGEEALRDLGLAYTTRLGGVWDLQRAGVHRSQSLCWSVRAAWRRMLSLAWNAYLFSRLEHTPLLRIAVHPVDIEHPRIWWQIKRMIAVGMKTRTAETYEGWVYTRGGRT